MKILLSNPSIQYCKHTFKALHRGGHEVVFATAYWYRPYRLLEQVLSLTSLKKYLNRYHDEAIPNQLVITYFLNTCFHFIIKFLPFDVEQKSYWEDRLHDRWVARFIKKWKPDLVIGYEKSVLYSFIAADSIGATKLLDLAQVHPNTINSLRIQLPFFVSITGTEHLFRKISALKKKEYELANSIACLSNYAAATLTEAGISKYKIFVNPLGFDEKVFYPSDQKETAVVLPVQFIYTGIITKRKGVEILLEAFSQISPQLANLTLIGPPGDAIAIVNKFLDRSNISYYPYMNQGDLANSLRAADVFVFPSYLDSWAAVVLEAMAAGLPVIVTNHTGTAQLVTVKNGMVIQAGKKEALINAMHNFIQFPNLVRVMGRSAATIAQAHTWQAYSTILLEQINTITNRPKYV